MKISAFPLILLLSVASFAHSQITSGEWIYTLDASDEATIVGYSGAGGEVEIPSNVDGYAVRQVGAGGPLPQFGSIFGSSGNSSVTGVLIGHGVASIGDHAFATSTALISVTIPDSVTSIGDNAFYGCINLESVYFQGDMPSVGAGLFAGIAPAGSVYYPADSVTWDETFGGWPTQPYDVIIDPLPDDAVFDAVFYSTPRLLDRRRPVLRITAPVAASVSTRARRFILQGNASDNVSPTRVRFRIKPPRGKYGRWAGMSLNGNSATKVWSRPVALSRRGAWAVQIRAFDSAGNASTTRTVFINRF